jgi:hypothetical protein
MTCIGGCAQPDFTRTESAPQLPAYTGKVSVLKQFPYDGYVLIGTIFVRGGLTVSEQKMRKSLREKSAAQGANAIVMQGKLRTLGGDNGSDTQLAAWAIFVKER